MRGATLGPLDFFVRSDISIHAPHAGRDVRFGFPDVDMAISIHAPHAGRDWAVFHLG